MSKMLAGESRNIKPQGTPVVLELYVTGASPNSVRAITNLRTICEEHLRGRYSLRIIDVYQHPELAGKVQIYALPLLIRRAPLPERKFIGDLSQTKKVIEGLSL
jgi:circadian clock protein KaiB